MGIGTKSLLFGAHQVLIHALFVAWAWWKLYGFPWDVRLWIAFIVHDLGYWHKADMDGEDGERHPEFGAWLMRSFGSEWEKLVLFHSRFLAKKAGMPPSRLCFADKLSIVLMPWWLYVPLARLTGEIKEYRKLCDDPKKYKSMNLPRGSDRIWYKSVQLYLKEWITEHAGGAEDTWTPAESDV